MFDKLIATLKSTRRTIVFTEGTDARILSAADRLLKEDLMGVVLVGNADAVKAAYASHDKYFILQELFGAHERVAVPISKFKPEREEGCMYPITKFEEVSKEEAFGR